jgi:hypothetical protein
MGLAFGITVCSAVPMHQRTGTPINALPDPLLHKLSIHKKVFTTVLHHYAHIALLMLLLSSPVAPVAPGDGVE